MNCTAHGDGEFTCGSPRSLQVTADFSWLQKPFRSMTDKVQASSVQFRHSLCAGFPCCWKLMQELKGYSLLISLDECCRDHFLNVTWTEHPFWGPLFVVPFLGSPLCQRKAPKEPSPLPFPNPESQHTRSVAWSKWERSKSRDRLRSFFSSDWVFSQLYIYVYIYLYIHILTLLKESQCTDQGLPLGSGETKAVENMLKPA